MVGRVGRCPRLLLVVGLVIIGLSVLAMHQLAVDHTLALPATSHAWHAADHHAILPAGAPHALPAGSAQPALAVVFDEDSCSAGCSTDDDMSVAACLLALTLLALCWRLTPPRPYPLPAAAPRSPAPLPLALDRRAALSLAELSIRRT